MPPNQSKVYSQISKIKEYATENEMKLNCKKSKFMFFNPTENVDFDPCLEIEGQHVDTVEEMRLLGLIFSNDLKWRANTDAMTKNAYARLWMMKRLKVRRRGANLTDLIDVYIKQVRSILEFGVPLWNSAITQEETLDIERVQKSFLHIAMGNNYHSYESALERAELESLEARRTKLCLSFAKKAAKHPKHKHWFAPSDSSAPDTRSEKFTFKKPLCRLTRLKKSPIPYLTGLLNNC